MKARSSCRPYYASGRAWRRAKRPTSPAELVCAKSLSLFARDGGEVALGHFTRATIRVGTFPKARRPLDVVDLTNPETGRRCVTRYHHGGQAARGVRRAAAAGSARRDGQVAHGCTRTPEADSSRGQSVRSARPRLSTL